MVMHSASTGGSGWGGRDEVRVGRGCVKVIHSSYAQLWETCDYWFRWCGAAT